ncbi:hypothetical protein GOBAR_DD08792 [Gossypium barbadense]|nr:hypothetical protein GOBAR_DD08792 [Gossypium barbadense]
MVVPPHIPRLGQPSHPFPHPPLAPKPKSEPSLELELEPLPLPEFGGSSYHPNLGVGNYVQDDLSNSYATLCLEQAQKLSGHLLCKQITEDGELIFQNIQRAFESVHLSDRLCNIDRGVSTSCHDIRTGIIKCLEPLAIIPSVSKINSVGPRLDTESTTDGLRNSKHFKLS